MTYRLRWPRWRRLAGRRSACLAPRGRRAIGERPCRRSSRGRPAVLMLRAGKVQGTTIFDRVRSSGAQRRGEATVTTSSSGLPARGNPDTAHPYRASRRRASRRGNPVAAIPRRLAADRGGSRSPADADAWPSLRPPDNAGAPGWTSRCTFDPRAGRWSPAAGGRPAGLLPGDGQSLLACRAGRRAGAPLDRVCRRRPLWVP